MAQIFATESSDNQQFSEEQKNWNHGTSANGETYVYAAVDESGQKVDEPKDQDGHQVDASGPKFDNHKVNWYPDGQEHETDERTAAVTAIWKYQFGPQPSVSIPSTVPYPYVLKIWTRDSYNYNFYSNVDAYGLDVYVTKWPHTVGMITRDPTITSISGR